MTDKKKSRKIVNSGRDGYEAMLSGVAGLLEQARRTAVRTVNAIMTAVYWEIGRRIVAYEQAGEMRAEYGSALLKRLSGDLTRKFGRGFSVDNLETMRLFYQTYPDVWRRIDFPKSETASRISLPNDPAERFPLPWSHYVMLVKRTRSAEARAFYEAEAIRGGWSVRQLNRQIYKMALPNEKALIAEIDKTRKELEAGQKGGEDAD